MPYFAAGAVALGALAGAIALARKNDPSVRFEKALKAAEEYASKIKELTDQQTKNNERIKELNELKENGTIGEMQEKELANLNAENALIQTQIDLYERLQSIQQREARKAAKEKANNLLNPNNAADTYGIGDALANYNHAREQYENAVKEASAKGKDTSYSVRAYSKQMETYAKHLSNMLSEYADIRGSLDEKEDAALIAALDQKVLEVRVALGMDYEQDDDLSKFKRDLKKLQDQTGKTFNKVEDIVEDKSEEVQKWLEDTGYSVEDLGKYFLQMASDVDNSSSSSVSTADSIANLTSLREELAITTAALEEYKKALEGGEKGDLAKQYEDAYKGAVSDIESDRTDTRRVKATAHLIYSPEQLKAFGYDLNKVADDIQNNEFLKAIFSEDGDYGTNLVNAAKNFSDVFGDAVEVTEDVNGNLKFTYTSLKAMSENSGFSTGFIAALLDDLDAHGAEVMMSQDEFGKLASKLNEIQSGAQSAQAAMQSFIAYLALAGNDEFAILNILSQLRDAGLIEFDDTEIIDYIGGIKAAADQYNADPAHLDVETNGEEAVAKVIELAEGIDGNEYTASVTDGGTAGATKKKLDELEQFQFTPKSITITAEDDGSIPKEYEGLAIYRIANGLDVTTGLPKRGTDYSGNAVGSPIIRPRVEVPPGDYEAIAHNFDELADAVGAQLSKNAISAAENYYAAQKKLEQAEANGDDTTQLTIDANAAQEELVSTLQQLDEFSAEHPEVKLDALDNVSSVVAEVFSEINSLPDVKRINIIARYGKTVADSEATGTKNAPGGPTLVNELGPELISDNGVAYIADDGKPTITTLSPGAIVLNAQDTRKALSGSGHDRIIPSFANGTKDGLIHGRRIRAAANAYDSGLAGGKIQSPSFWTKLWNGITSSVKNNAATVKKTDHTQSSSGGGGGGGGGGSGSQASSTNDKQKIDWIEVAIDRFKRAVDALQRVFENSFKTLSARMEASVSEMERIRAGFATYQQGYDRYIKEANSVGLDAGLAKLVRDGTIDIRSYDEDTQKLIGDYKSWYEKALDCKDAIDDLHESLAQLYKDRFETVQNDYENRLSLIGHESEMIEKDISMVQQRGYLESASFYQRLFDTQTRSITMMRSELADLEKYLSDGVLSGEIQMGSEAWYDMNSAIIEVKESIADANVQLVEYENKIRSIRWDTFDYAIDRFSTLSDEAEFFVSLMENSKLFDDDGQLTSAGLSTIGMHALEFNVHMSEADAYAKELLTIQKELANNPFDTALIERREKLLELQRQSILAAESEKVAVKDLVSDGIELELDALKELIDAYGDSLDSAKDLYEYQKKVTEKTTDIASIQKQLSAYVGDTSEESRSRIQKLNKDLKKAQQDLQETERDQTISEQKKLLDDLYSEYEELINERLNNIDGLMRDMIDVTNANLVDIKETILDFSSKTGYSLTDEISNGLSGMLSDYSGGFSLSPYTDDYLDGIYRAVSAMALASGAVKAYSSGGLVDYTGLAQVHGTPGKPELMLNASDTENLLQSITAMRQTPILSALNEKHYQGLYGTSFGGGVTIGSIDLGGINIAEAQNIDDILAQIRDSKNFEKMIHYITDVSYLKGGGSFRKNKIKFN